MQVDTQIRHQASDSAVDGSANGGNRAMGAGKSSAITNINQLHRPSVKPRMFPALDVAVYPNVLGGAKGNHRCFR
jgi:hypothetical protein